MASWFQRLFLTLLVSLTSGVAVAQEEPLEPIVGADIERRQIEEDMLDSENFEIGVWGGVLGIEDFGSNSVTGASLAYHVTEDFFLRASYGVSEANKTSYELLSGAVELLNEEEREYTYYDLSLGYKIFPGQVFIGSKLAFNTHFYLQAGGGNTEFAGNRYNTWSLGAGYKFYATDWFAMELGMRDHIFTHELFGESKRVNNFEGHLGLSIFF